MKENGGEVLGAVRHPLGTTDFSSFLLQAQSSGAKVIGLANAGLDTANAIKGAAEFGIVQAGQQLAGLLMWVPAGIPFAAWGALLGRRAWRAMGAAA